METGSPQKVNIFVVVKTKQNNKNWTIYAGENVKKSKDP
jgi:hypothetical protein